MQKDYRRCEARAPVHGAGSLCWDDPAQGALSSSVSVRNLSGQGLQVVSPRLVHTGAVVFLTGQTYECLGEVKYCVLSDGAFRVGIQFLREPYKVTGPARAI